jgi:signal transduction histidine kinase
VVQLVQNAVEHTDDGDEIALGALTTSTGARLYVRDTGVGFGDRDPDELFERFVGERRGGTGLGLAIVRAIAEAHGGTATAHHAPGGGALLVIDVARDAGGGRTLAAPVGDGAGGATLELDDRPTLDLGEQRM